MMIHEFENLTGLTGKAISMEQYAAIEKIYMDSDEDKQTFCKKSYDVYSKTVSAATSRVIAKATLQEKLDLIDRVSDVLEKRADEVRERKTWELIKLLSD